jgi:hypothetical protein
VIEKIGTSSYKLDIPKSWKNIHPVFNEVLLTPYREPEFPGQPKNTRPPPEDVKGQEPEYEVNEIVDVRKDRKGKFWYKVDWKGYGPHEQTWEPTSNLTNAKKAVQEFHVKFPTKPKPKSIAKVEIPISSFPKELLRSIPQPLTDSIPMTIPTENMVMCCMRNGIRALERG